MFIMWNQTLLATNQILYDGVCVFVCVCSRSAPNQGHPYKLYNLQVQMQKDKDKDGKEDKQTRQNIMRHHHHLDGHKLVQALDNKCY